jgi:bis(5'-nucleosyl)-tetraphosphatase (symmetrical)
MATYAIGDIQGCYHAFKALLAALEFDSARDKLWLVGDIINRGSGSLEVLRWCYQHQDAIKIVLGNHDLHALAVKNGIKQAHKYDTLQTSIDAAESDVLFAWLRHQPLLHRQKIGGHDYAMVHAGLFPQWTLDDAFALAQEIEAALQANEYNTFLTHMYGNQPKHWHDDLTGYDRLRVITNAMTRMRVCSLAGEMEFEFKGELQNIPQGYVPWFDMPERNSQTTEIICGHWSALGLRQRNNVHALDTGCLWGGQLTAMCLETQLITQVSSDPRDQPLVLT